MATTHSYDQELKDVLKTLQFILDEPIREKNLQTVHKGRRSETDLIARFTPKLIQKSKYILKLLNSKTFAEMDKLGVKLEDFQVLHPNLLE